MQIDWMKGKIINWKESIEKWEFVIAAPFFYVSPIRGENLYL